MTDKIAALKKEKNAIILAHNYQPPEILEIADLCGDSLELSIKASETDAQVIVFCGVHFMAETASILSPEKKVLLPRLDAGCPMADMITPESLKAKKAELPGIPVVTYVNSTAAVKALSTVCCTSANVVKIISALESDEVLMTPDRNLAMYAESKTDKKVHLWDGCCPIHDILTVEDLEKTKKAHPDAISIAHPECRLDVSEAADVVTSTSGMIRYAAESDAKEFIIATEVGLLYPLRKACPDKIFYPAFDGMVCDDMKKTTLKDVEQVLENLSNEVRVPEEIAVLARQSVSKMIETS